MAYKRICNQSNMRLNLYKILVYHIFKSSANYTYACVKMYNATFKNKNWQIYTLLPILQYCYAFIAQNYSNIHRRRSFRPSNCRQKFQFCPWRPNIFLQKRNSKLKHRMAVRDRFSSFQETSLAQHKTARYFARVLGFEDFQIYNENLNLYIKARKHHIK